MHEAGAASGCPKAKGNLLYTVASKVRVTMFNCIAHQARPPIAGTSNAMDRGG